MQTTDNTTPNTPSRWDFLMAWLILFLFCGVSIAIFQVGLWFLGLISAIIAAGICWGLSIMHLSRRRFKKIFGVKAPFKKEWRLRQAFQQLIDEELEKRAANFLIWCHWQNNSLEKRDVPDHLMGGEVRILSECIGVHLLVRRKEFSRAHRLAELYGFNVKGGAENYVTPAITKKSTPTKKKTA